MTLQQALLHHIDQIVVQIVGLAVIVRVAVAVQIIDPVRVWKFPSVLSFVVKLGRLRSFMQKDAMETSSVSQS